MRVGVPNETAPGERRVATTPETAKKLAKKGFSIVIESGAGNSASQPDADYEAAGCELGDPWSCPVVLKVEPPSVAEADKLQEGAVLIGMAHPQRNEELVAKLLDKKVTWVGLEFVPRIARAQRMDVLSSMANIAGYRAVIEASMFFPRFFPMLMTAAGTVPPAHCLVVGAGVAGLSAIATAKRLGAVVRAFDTRPAVADQVRSLGARFLDMDMDDTAEDAGGYATEMTEEFIRKEMELLHKNSKECDIIITTALIRGRYAPTLIKDYMVADMKPGSVIVDLAAPGGGNCELTKPGEVIEHDGVTIIGYTDMASRMAFDASRLYARNVQALLNHLKGKAEEGLDLNFDDEIVKGVVLLHEGNKVHPVWSEE